MITQVWVTFCKFNQLFFPHKKKIKKKIKSTKQNAPVRDNLYFTFNTPRHVPGILRWINSSIFHNKFLDKYNKLCTPTLRKNQDTWIFFFFSQYFCLFIFLNFILYFNLFFTIEMNLFCGHGIFRVQWLFESHVAMGITLWHVKGVVVFSTWSSPRRRRRASSRGR